MSVAFSTSNTPLERQAEQKPALVESLDVDTEFEIKDCIRWISDNNYQKVALQFPDEMLASAAMVADKLHSATSSETFILADTSYGSCCVDEVAAEHYQADALIHYGRTCLSATRRLPLRYVFGHQPLDVPDCVSHLTRLVDDEAQHVVVIYDVVYHHQADELQKQISSKFSNVVIAQVRLPNSDGDSRQIAEDSESVQAFGCHIQLLPATVLSQYIVFYVGQEGAALTNWMLHLKDCTFFTYDPVIREGKQQSINVNRYLMKRYYLIEKAKDARIVGLLVGTLGVADYMDILDRMKRLAKLAGKKTYTFVVGKINVPKLANFMEIDIYVLVSCPQNALLDSADFYRPVITPYEMEIACNYEREWDGHLVTEFRKLLHGGSAYVKEPEKALEGGDVSLITGGLRHVTTDDDNTTSAASQSLVEQNLEIMSQNTAGAVLAGRSWQGLEPELGRTPVEKAKEGRSGIPMAYENPSDVQKT